MDSQRIAGIIRRLTMKYRSQTGEVFDYSSATEILHKLQMLDYGVEDYESFRARASDIEKEAAKLILDPDPDDEALEDELEAMVAGLDAGQPDIVYAENDYDQGRLYRAFEKCKDEFAHQYNTYREICIAMGQPWERSNVCDIENGYYAQNYIDFASSIDQSILDYNESLKQGADPCGPATFDEVFSALDFHIAAGKGLEPAAPPNDALTENIRIAMVISLGVSSLGDALAGIHASKPAFLEIYRKQTELGFASHLRGLGLKPESGNPGDHVWQPGGFPFGEGRLTEKPEPRSVKPKWHRRLSRKKTPGDNC